MCAPRKYFFRFANFRVFVRLFFFFRSFFIRTCFHMQNPCAGATERRRAAGPEHRATLRTTAANAAAARPQTPGRPPRTRSKRRPVSAARSVTPLPSAGRSKRRGDKAPNTVPSFARPLQMPRRPQSTEQPPSAHRGRRQFTAGKAPTAPARTPRWRRCRSRSPARQWRTASRTFR